MMQSTGGAAMLIVAVAVNDHDHAHVNDQVNGRSLAAC
jgi:hypothetical protein